MGFSLGLKMAAHSPAQWLMWVIAAVIIAIIWHRKGPWLAFGVLMMFMVVLGVATGGDLGFYLRT